MMKKVFVSIALAAVALGGQAQIVKNDLLKGYKEGDVLEKTVYNDKRAPINVDTWCGGFTSKPVEGSASPTIGKALTYEGYSEAGPSITLGFPQGVKGSRVSVYSLVESGKVYSKGTYYIACLANFSKVGTNLADFLAASASYVGGGNRGQVYVRREGNDKIKFAVGLLKERAEAPMAYDCNKTHLLVLKVDYTKNEVSLFVDPELGQSEPKADIVVTGEEGALKAGLKSVALRNRNGFKGNIGNFRFAKDWAGAIGK